MWSYHFWMEVQGNRNRAEVHSDPLYRVCHYNGVPSSSLEASKLCSVLFQTFISTFSRSRKSQIFQPPLYPYNIQLKPTARAFLHYNFLISIQHPQEKSASYHSTLNFWLVPSSCHLLYAHMLHMFKPPENLLKIFPYFSSLLSELFRAHPYHFILDTSITMYPYYFRCPYSLNRSASQHWACFTSASLFHKFLAHTSLLISRLIQAISNSIQNFQPQNCTLFQCAESHHIAPTLI